LPDRAHPARSDLGREFVTFGQCFVCHAGRVYFTGT
jgi:hypothetical protein